MTIAKLRDIVNNPMLDRIAHWQVIATPITPRDDSGFLDGPNELLVLFIAHRHHDNDRVIALIDTVSQATGFTSEADLLDPVAKAIRTEAEAWQRINRRGAYAAAVAAFVQREARQTGEAAEAPACEPRAAKRNGDTPGECATKNG